MKTLDLVVAARALPDGYVSDGLDLAAFFWASVQKEVIIAAHRDHPPMVWMNEQWSRIDPMELPPRRK